jgi:hypothetical protein
MRQGWIALFALTLMTGSMLSAGAEDAKTDSDLNHYLEQLQIKLEHTAQRSNQPGTAGSSVVGLRGSKQEPLSHQLYWKGKKVSGPVSPDEVKLMRTALEQARTGHKTESVAMLQTFEQKYPKSALLPDVQQTLQKLNGPQPPAAVPVPAAPVH